MKIHKVTQILETDSVSAANAMLESGNWMLLNSYKKGSLSIIPVTRLGRIAELEPAGEEEMNGWKKTDKKLRKTTLRFY